MKKRTFILIFILFFNFSTAFAQEHGKALVVYYSRDGHTKTVAEKIAARADAVTERLIDTKNRIGKLATIGAGNDAVFHKETVIKKPQNDPREFDIIFVGTPAWFGNMTPAVRTYLNMYDLADRDVRFFATCHKVGGDKATQQMAELVYGDRAGEVPQLPLTHEDLQNETLDKGIERLYSQGNKRRENMNAITKTLFCLTCSALIANTAYAHCEIPCGIYDDKARIAMIAEDITTVEKSMTEIEKLSAEQPANYNQIVRWVDNKDVHATKIQDTAWQYFMAQRIKPVDASDQEAYNKYVTQLTLMHRISVAAMKAKQTLDQAYIAEMRELLTQFETSYF